MKRLPCPMSPRRRCFFRTAAVIIGGSGAVAALVNHQWIGLVLTFGYGPTLWLIPGYQKAAYDVGFFRGRVQESKRRPIIIK